MLKAINYSFIITIVILIIIILYLIKYHRRPSYLNISPNEKTFDIHKQLIQTNQKTKNVLFFMSLDYPEVPEYGKLSIKVIKDYCHKHNYSFKIFDHYNKSNDISPYWLRVRDLNNILKNESYSTIIYIDLDVIINPKFFNERIENLMHSIDNQTNNNWNIYIPADPNFTNYGINTGIIIIKNNNWSKQFIEHWFNSYPNDFWSKENNKWSCMKHTNACIFAGDEYEQGMINRFYERNILNCKKYIVPVDFKTIGEKNINNSPFMYHFMGMNDTKRLQNMNYLYP